MDVLEHDATLAVDARAPRLGAHKIEARQGAQVRLFLRKHLTDGAPPILRVRPRIQLNAVRQQVLIELGPVGDLWQRHQLAAAKRAC